MKKETDKEAVKLDLFAWIRGPFRDFGIDHELLKRVLKDLEALLPETKQSYTLVANLGPDNPRMMGYAQQKAARLGFFAQNGFIRD